MKDFIGNEVFIGDEVLAIVPNYHELVYGEVVKLTEKGVIIKYENHYGRTKNTFRASCQFVKV